MFSDRFHAKRKHRIRMRRLDRSKGRFKPRYMTLSAILIFVIGIAFYTVLVMSWWEAPIYMAIGALLEWCRKKGFVIFQNGEDV